MSLTCFLRVHIQNNPDLIDFTLGVSLNFGNSLLLLGDENNDWIHWKLYTKLSKTLHRVNKAAGVCFYALIALLFISIHKLLCRDKRRQFTLLWCLFAVIFALVDSFKWSFKTSRTLKSLINWSILMSNKFKLKWPRKVYFKSAQWLNPKKNWKHIERTLSKQESNTIWKVSSYF